MELVEAFLEILAGPTILAVIVGLMPVLIGFLCGVMVGWAWKPRWASLGNCKFEFSAPSSPYSLIPSPVKAFGSTQNFEVYNNNNNNVPSFDSSSCCVLDNGLEIASSAAVDNSSFCSTSELREDDSMLIPDEDLKHLCHLVGRKDGGPPWKHMMDRSTNSMSYQAWHRDPENGPPQYCSKTVYEDATPELLRDFFWDDEFRLKWDNMLIHAAVLEECATTGTSVVHWIRKFPFFCSDREYIIGRRIWESGRLYYCVTKGVPCLSVPTRDKPRRVDLYYSSWFIQAVESRKGSGQLSACEVILFHHEDMGIPWEIAKFGIRQGMWGAVKNIERGFRAYQKHRASGAPLSRHVIIAEINTKINPDYLKILEGEDEDSSETQLLPASTVEKPKGLNIPKLLIFSGVVAIACSLDQGLLTKTIIYGVARRFGNFGRKACPRTN